MKKAFLVLALVATMFAAGQAQAQIIYAGYTPETFSSDNSSKNYQGFCVGFNTDFDLTKKLGVAVGAQFRMNMRSATQTLWGFTGKVKETQILVDVPILFNYKFAVNRDLAIIPFVGPMPSLALSGTTKGADPIFGENSSNWYGDNGYMRRFNLYGVLGASFSISDFNVFAGYRFGFLDLDKSDNVKTTTNGFFVGVGFEL